MTQAEERLRACYADTAFARMGIPFEQAMESEVVRGMVENAAGMVVSVMDEMRAA